MKRAPKRTSLKLDKIIVFKLLCANKSYPPPEYIALLYCILVLLCVSFENQKVLMRRVCERVSERVVYVYVRMCSQST